MKKILGTALGLCLLAGVPAHAQFGGLGGLIGGALKGGGGGDVDGVITSGTRIIVFETIAMDLAVASALQMLDAFPAEKVEEIRGKFLTFNEIKAKRGPDDQLDATAIQCGTDGFSAMAKLNPEDYQKGNDKVIRSAYMKMGLALGADAVAATQLPTFVTSGAKAVSSLASNPLQLTKLGKLRTIVGTVGVLAKAVPTQIGAIRTVRGMAKSIADAQGIKLGEPAAITTLDPVVLAADVKTEAAD